MKISLCMIVGNVEEYIERCLASFLPIADEVCLVRAIGNQSPDRTMEIARRVVSLAGIPFRDGEYKNLAKAGPLGVRCRPAEMDIRDSAGNKLPTFTVVDDADPATWPHVDSFAAARQMSFDLASHDYCFWCDSDDVLESGAEVVRELAGRGGYGAFIFPYRIVGRDVIIPRERMILKSAGKWLYPVHECFHYHIEPVQAVEDQRVVVAHLPNVQTKKGGNERNLRILKSIPDAERTPGLLFHLYGELIGAGDIAGGLKVAREALDTPGLGKPERYDILTNISFYAKDPNEIETLLHSAFQTDPQRREALYLLASNALNFDRPDLAMTYARQMLATPKPATADWNVRENCYGWAGEELWQQCLRANGMLQQAEDCRMAGMKKYGPPRIALLHATRGRPQQASIARKTWLMFAERPELVEHIFVFDDDDQDSLPLSRMRHAQVKAGGGCVAAWNAGLALTQAQVVIQMSDDWLPPLHWDRLIMERLGNVEESKVLAVSDGARTDRLLCMAIATRSYCSQDCFLFHPWFTGVYSDNWFTDEAYRRGQVIEARDLVFQHQHPAFGSAKMDATYAQQNAPARYVHGEQVYHELQKRNDWSSVPGFFNYWPFYQYVARQLKPGDTVAEVGVWLGRSSIFLAQELARQGKRDVKIIAVDNFRGESNQIEHEATVRAAGGSIRARFEENIARCGVEDRFQILEGDSALMASQVPDGSLAFCYIDAAHDYESVKRDIAAWLPKVKPGGMIAGHDADWDPVLQAVLEFFPKAIVKGAVWIVGLP